MRVLVVDDNADLVEVLVEYLSNLDGIDVVPFTDPQSALLFAANNQVDVVLTDYEMPGIDGVALAEALALLQEAPNTIIAMTGSSDTSRLTGCSHISHVLTKPFSLTVLCSVLESIL